MSKNQIFTFPQFSAVSHLNDIFINGVKRLIFESMEEHVDFISYQSSLVPTPNNLIVEYRYTYADVTFLLLALVDREGNLFLPDFSKAECEIDYIYVID